MRKGKQFIVVTGLLGASLIGGVGGASGAAVKQNVLVREAADLGFSSYDVQDVGGTPCQTDQEEVWQRSGASQAVGQVAFSPVAGQSIALSETENVSDVKAAPRVEGNYVKWGLKPTFTAGNDDGYSCMWRFGSRRFLADWTASRYVLRAKRYEGVQSLAGWSVSGMTSGTVPTIARAKARFGAPSSVKRDPEAPRYCTATWSSLGLTIVVANYKSTANPCSRGYLLWGLIDKPSKWAINVAEASHSFIETSGFDYFKSNMGIWQSGSNSDTYVFAKERLVGSRRSVLFGGKGKGGVAKAYSFLIGAPGSYPR